MDLAAQLTAIDFRNLWHPFTQTAVWTAEPPLIIERADGCELIAVDGSRYLDGVSSLWCNVHGHNHPQIVAAICEQAQRLCHSTLLGLSHRPILEFTERLVQVVPAGLSRIFYSDSGSAAVEAALRMSVEWWRKQPSPEAQQRTRFLSLEEAYHGDTLGSVSVGFSQAFHQHLSGNVVPALRIDPPHLFRFYRGASAEEAEELSLRALRDTLERHGHELAAFIVEPLMQGAAGMWRQSERWLQQAVMLCRKHGLHIIVDEVATGFGKAGTLFACERAGVVPDFLVMGKGITGGMLPMSAVATSEEIFAAFTGPVEARKTFFYGQTYAGNPLAAAAASVSLDLFRRSGFFEELRQRIAFFQELLEREVAPLSVVDEIRTMGMMAGIELTVAAGKRESFPPSALIGPRIVREARSRGAFIRPLGNVMVLMPALSMDRPQLERLVSITAESIASVAS